MAGKLFYLMGSSGAGKDSLLKLCLDRLQDQPVLVAHRYITRLPEQEGENHIWLPAAEFRKRRALDLFALCWSANGFDYGIGCEIDLWLARGHHVLVNGSRAFLAQAQERYGSALIPVLIKVAPDQLRRRLINRGRETPAEVENRVARAARFAASIPPGTATVDNSGELEQAYCQLADLLDLPADALAENALSEPAANES